MTQKNSLKHVAIIMDGNGRWAKKHGQTRNQGHQKGAEVLRCISEHANKRGIQILTVYAFSTENWKRPEEEVQGLMKLLKKYLNNHIKDAKKNNIKFKILGDKEGLPADIRAKIIELENVTADKTEMTVNLAINYGGRNEIVRAMKKIAQETKQENFDAETITEDYIASYLDTDGLPDPDLMIRTSGEQRISNFLTWQLAYSEFYFTECLWPDFTVEQFDHALEVFEQRQRRFGKSE
ncbi:MAG: isoprenyl transferase [Cellulosilyticaceae bacterium]